MTYILINRNEFTVYRFPLQPSKAVFSKTYINSYMTVYNYKNL